MSEVRRIMKLSKRNTKRMSCDMSSIQYPPMWNRVQSVLLNLSIYPNIFPAND